MSLKATLSTGKTVDMSAAVSAAVSACMGDDRNKRESADVGEWVCG